MDLHQFVSARTSCRGKWLIRNSIFWLITFDRTIGDTQSAVGIGIHGFAIGFVKRNDGFHHLRTGYSQLAFMFFLRIFQCNISVVHSYSVFDQWIVAGFESSTDLPIHAKRSTSSDNLVA